MDVGLRGRLGLVLCGHGLGFFAANRALLDVVFAFIVSHRAGNRHAKRAYTKWIRLAKSEIAWMAGRYTRTGSSFQMSRAYSAIVRSLENLPMRAVLRIAIFAQRGRSRNAASTFSCASL